MTIRAFAQIIALAACSLGFSVLCVAADEQDHKKGTVTGVLTGKGDKPATWIEIRADGEEKSRKYLLLKQGTPELLKAIHDTHKGTRVRAEWVFAEHFRVVKLETLSETRTGTIIGEIRSKKDINDGKNTQIEVLAPGEEKARAYFVQYDPKIQGPLPDVLRAVRAANVGEKVELNWESTGHGPAIRQFKVLKKASDENSDGGRKGKVTGIVTAKGDNWIEVKADGEEKARRYVPHWKGGAPAAGGGPDKEMLADIKATALKSRVEIEWEFEERPRVVKITVLKKEANKPSDK